MRDEVIIMACYNCKLAMSSIESFIEKVENFIKSNQEMLIVFVQLLGHFWSKNVSPIIIKI